MDLSNDHKPAISSWYPIKLISCCMPNNRKEHVLQVNMGINCFRYDIFTVIYKCSMNCYIPCSCVNGLSSHILTLKQSNLGLHFSSVLAYRLIESFCHLSKVTLKGLFFFIELLHNAYHCIVYYSYYSSNSKQCWDIRNFLLQTNVG